MSRLTRTGCENASGKYRLIGGKFVKVSEEVPKLRKPVFLPEGGKFYEEFNDEAHPMGQWVDSKDEKRRIMRELNLEEVSSV